MYLTESYLYDLLTTTTLSIVRQYSFPGSRYRFDFFIDADSFIIEFDGPQHYTDSTVQMRDIEKSNLVKQSNLYLIRIPYFVQLDETTNFFYFRKDLGLRNDYKHGFRDSKAKTPADFNRYGLQRYVAEMKQLPISTNEEINESLNCHVHYQNHIKLFK